MQKLLKLCVAMLFIGHGYICFATNYYVKQEYLIPHDTTNICNSVACEYEIVHFWVEENYGGEFDFTYNGIKRNDTTYAFEVVGRIFGNDTLRDTIYNKSELFINVGEAGANCITGGLAGGVAILAPDNDNHTGNALWVIVFQCQPIAKFAINTSNTVCQHTCVQFTDSSLYRPRHWQWKIFNVNNTIIYEDTLQNINYCFGDTGTYFIQQKAWNAKGIDSTIQSIKVIESPIITDSITQNITLTNITETTLTACAEGELYDWFPKQNLSCTNCTNAVATVNEDATYYCVVSNTNGCADTCYYNIIAPFDIFVPTAFSPNNDGINDIFKVRGINIEVQSIKIYNRWGNEIYNGNLENGWNGKYKDEVVENGIYAYSLIYRNKKTNRIIRMNGIVTVVK